MFAIKKMRNRAGLDQKDVADALGITVRRYGGWEREEREINLRDAIRLADLFGCTLDELAGRPWPSRDLPPDERELLDAYQSATLDGRRLIMLAARAEGQAREVAAGVSA